MYSLILSLVLSSPSVLAERLDVEVDGQQCKIKKIYYNETQQIILAIGNCQEFYDMCTRDFCRARKFTEPDIFNINTDNIGLK